MALALVWLLLKGLVFGFQEVQCSGDKPHFSPLAYSTTRLKSCAIKLGKLCFVNNFYPSSILYMAGGGILINRGLHNGQMKQGDIS